MSRCIAVLIVVTLTLPSPGAAQGIVTADVWRDFAKQIQVGSELRVRLRNGQKFTATLVGAVDEAMLVQPKTRRPVDVQRVAYGDIESLERRKTGGNGVVKAVGIGAGIGAGVFLGFFLVAVAAFD